jgi:hypothetical protein
MESKQPAEKEVAEVANRRASIMTVENPLSPSTTLSDSNSIISVETRHSRYSRDDADTTISNQLSRTSTNAIGGVVPTLDRTTTTGTTGTLDLAYEVDFEEGDRNNPQNWSFWFRGCVIAIFSYSTTCVVLYSTSYTSAIPGMLEVSEKSLNRQVLVKS